MKISLITVNYNTEKYIALLIKSLSSQTISKQDFELIIVNNSQNSILEDTCNETLYSFNIKIIQSPENVGFGRANNLGSKDALGEYLLIINPDITVHDDSYLEQLYSFATDNPQYGIISTRVIESNGEDAHPSYSYAYGIHFDLPGNIASVIGALMLIKKTLFERVDGFDPDFFLYDEETDLCLRIRKLGYPLHQMDALSVKHFGRASETQKYKYDYWYKRQRGLYLFCLKHYSSEIFSNILKNDISKSRLKKITLWIQVYILQIKSKKIKYDRWLAIYDCAKRTQLSTRWLFYR